MTTPHDPGISTGEPVFDLHDGLTRFKFGATVFQMDLIEAFEQFNQIAKSMDGQPGSEYLTCCQAWVKKMTGTDLNRSATDALVHQIQMEYFAAKKKQRSAIDAILGSPSSTDSGPVVSVGSSD